MCVVYHGYVHACRVEFIDQELEHITFIEDVCSGVVFLQLILERRRIDADGFMFLCVVLVRVLTSLRTLRSTRLQTDAAQQSCLLSSI